MTLRKPENTGNWKRKCWIAISVEYAEDEVMDLSQNMLRLDDNN